MKVLTATALLFAIALPATAQAIPNSDSNLTNSLTGHSLGQEAMRGSNTGAIAPGNRIIPARIDKRKTIYLPPAKITPRPRLTIGHPVYKH